MSSKTVTVFALSVLLAMVSRIAASGEVAMSPWGPDDEIGVLNRYNDESRLDILARISSGKVYDLSVVNFVGMPGLADQGLGDPPMSMWFAQTPQGFRVEGIRQDEGLGAVDLYDDALIMSMHNGTHMDALNHLGFDGKIYNGFKAEDYMSAKGWKKAGADVIPPIITRGVLIDVAAYKGVDTLEESYAISIRDLEGALKSQGTSLERGDVALVRTGQMNIWPDKRFIRNEPGLTGESAKWLIDQGVTVIGADNLAVEVYPPDKSGSVHAFIFAKEGAYLLEMIWLEELSKDKLYEFALIAAPIRYRGATGSPIRPLALPIKKK